MRISELLEMDMGAAIDWMMDNKDEFSLVSESEMTQLIERRDHWEEKATELAVDIGQALGVDVGEHSSANCPVQNAIDVVYQSDISINN
jgi:hypothetical protein